MTPERVSSLDDQALRALGLSRQKMRYVRCLTETVVSGELKLEQLHRFDDEKVIEALTCVTGLGRWSAEMFLMFVLARPDVLPLGDLGIRKGFVRAYGLRNLPSERRMTDLASSWRPYRTIGCFYLWRILDLAPA